MEFRTIISIPKSAFPIDYSSRIFSIGSCFAVNISEKFSYFKFRNVVNPTGILFHPEAISRFVNDAVHQRKFSEHDLIFQQERYHCFDAHSDLSGSDPAGVVELLNNAISQAEQDIRAASHIIITLGTAWVYRLLIDGRIVANCHKVPQKEFSKELLSVDRIRECVENIITDIRELNKAAEVIFSVSPIRHLKDGFIENQRSKSNLISALHEAIADHQHVSYFPSYEIMMDELRDYRFYADEMIRPSRTAINYIWDRFS